MSQENNSVPELSELLQIRRDKLTELVNEGKNPFEQVKFDKTHYCADIENNFESTEGEVVSVAGRLMSKRGMGKVMFCDLQDVSGKIQLFVKLDVLGEASYAAYKKLDIGDIVGAKGEVFKTKTGQVSVRVSEYTLLSKSLLPLPEKFHGMTDTDLRYRQRYVDLIMNEKSRQTFLKRTQIIKEIRNFLDNLGFMEVETPVLHTIPGGAAARPFITHHNTLDIDLYMRIALELHLKRLIVGGFEKVYEIGSRGRRTGIATGLIDLDELTSGLQRSDLIVIAGRPATGKSAFALNIAAHAAIREGATVAVFSLEMSKEQVVMRIMASESGVNMQKLRTGELGATEILKIADRFNTVGEAKILIDDTPGVTVAEVRSKCRRIQAIHGLDVVIIDYLQLMQSAKSQDSRVLEISAMTRALKILARELNVAVVVLSQLSREPDKRKDHTPLMSDLRESGSIEQDADVIMMLYRPAAYPDTQEAMDGDNTSYINVAKHRNGATASIKVMWVPELTKYANYAPDPD